MVSAITVGITGHRWNKIPESEGARIAAQLSSVFTAIDLAVQGSGQTARCDDAVAIRLVSSLAEGADQLAIWSRPNSWTLDAILPFSRVRYLEDFAPAHATGGVDRRSEFEAALAQARSTIELPDTNDAVRGYELAGEMLIQESNILVAVWDGKAAAGPGGTEAVVTRAISFQIPVVWIYSDQDRAPMLLSAAPALRHPPTAVPADADMIRQTVMSVLETLALVARSHPVETRTP